jgi:hypothetical protein
VITGVGVGVAVGVTVGVGVGVGVRVAVGVAVAVGVGVRVGVFRSDPFSPALCSQRLRVFTLMTLEFGLVPLPLYARNR